MSDEKINYAVEMSALTLDYFVRGNVRLAASRENMIRAIQALDKTLALTP